MKTDNFQFLNDSVIDTWYEGFRRKKPAIRLSNQVILKYVWSATLTDLNLVKTNFLCYITVLFRNRINRL